MSFAQIEQQFLKRYTSISKNLDKGKVVRLDNSGKAFVAGTSYGKFIVLKYSTTGTVLKTITGSQIDTLSAMTIDMNNDVIAVGVVSTGGDFNYGVVKISNSGDSIVWAKSINLGGSDFPTAITTDTSGNIYVTGYRVFGSITQNLVDFYTVKIVGSTGDTVYTRRYNNASSNNKDFARCIVYDPRDNSVVVTGESYDVLANYNYFTIKYGAKLGDSIWSASYNNTAEDIPSAIALDQSGNIVVTGSSIGNIQDYLTIKYSSSGSVVAGWPKRFHNQRTDYARAVTTDNSGNVYVTGASFVGSEHDIVTIKYDPNGIVQWTNTYNGSGNSLDSPSGIGIDPFGNIIVVGYETGQVNEAPSSLDGLLLMISSTGTLRKANTYRGESPSADTVLYNPGEFTSLAIDQTTGAVWVTGYDSTAATADDIIVVKYESRNSIRGYIKRDRDGSLLTTDDQTALSGAKIVLDLGGNHIDSVYSQANGSYKIPLVFDGTYNIIQYPPDETWQSLQSIGGTGGNSQVSIGPSAITVSVANSQISINNGFIDYNPNDSVRYTTLNVQDYGVKKANKLSKKGKFISLPNAANIRDSIFLKSFPKKSNLKLVIGVTDSPATRWWISFKKSDDIQKIYPMNGKAKFFIQYNGKEYPKEGTTSTAKKSEKTALTASKHNNHLAAELVALKMNLLGSRDTILPHGLGNLIYDDGDPDNAMNGFTTNKVAAIVDSLLTYRGRPLASQDFVSVLASTADSVVTRINRSFRISNADTIKDTISMLVNGLRIEGSAPLSKAPYLRYNPNPEPKESFDLLSTKDIPGRYALNQNYPNPFNPTTTIGFELQSRSFVTMKVYNVLGQVVATLLHNEDFSEGAHDYQFDASQFSSGVYFVRLSVLSNNGVHFEDVKKMVLMK